MATTTTAERALAFEHAWLRAGSDSVSERPGGVELLTPSLPLVRGLNGLHVTGKLTVAMAQATARRVAAAGAREVELLAGDASVSSGTATRLATEGWAREAGKLMAWSGAAPAPARDARAVSVDRSRVSALRARWLAEEIPGADVVAQMRVADERLYSRTPTRAFCVCDEDGEAVAMALLIGAPGPVRMVEDIYTAPAHRRSGHATALVRAAVAAALGEGAEVVFLSTAATGAAAGLYERLGFRDLWRSSQLWRELSP